MGHAPWLLNVPTTDNDWMIWGLHHRISHDGIRQAILAQKNIATNAYVLEPIFQVEIKSWLQRNAQAHIEQTQAIGVVGHDITDVDFNDEAAKVSWISVHWQEHQDMEQALGI